MGHALKQLFSDFLSTIVFLAVYAASGDVLVATGVAIASAIAQFVMARLRNRKLDIMTLASVALVIVLGAATLLTRDPRFVLIKPSLAHFGIGAIMLKRGWMARYMPAKVMELAPDLPVIAGYWWAGLMFALGAGVVATALSGDTKLWGYFVFVVAPAAKIVAFAVQYALFRVLIGRRVAAAQASAS